MTTPLVLDVDVADHKMRDERIGVRHTAVEGTMLAFRLGEHTLADLNRTASNGFAGNSWWCPQFAQECQRGADMCF